MTKKEIVKAMSDLLGLPQQQVKGTVQKLLESVIETLAEEGRVELRNFGVFEVKKRKPRHARNPKTGEQVPIPARSVVTFKPGKEMEARVLEVMARKARTAKLAEPAPATPTAERESNPSNSTSDQPKPGKSPGTA
ncbi:MAG: HU family DNA-binding protein [Planctomycetota bacterium]